MKKTVVVYKKSLLEMYLNSYDKAVRDYATYPSAEQKALVASDIAQKETLELVVGSLKKNGYDFELMHRAELARSGLSKDLDFAISLGGDGTFLETSHYISGVPLLGVNSDSANSVGYYCRFNSQNIDTALAAVDSLQKSVIPRMEITLDGIVLKEKPLNDILFAHSNPADMTRYTLKVDSQEESKCKSSGLLVATSGGSTAWMYQEDGNVMELSDTRLQYKHRGKRGSKAEMATMLEFTSQTREGKIFIDGSHLQYAAGLGARVKIKNAEPLVIVGNLAERQRSYI